MAFSIGEAYVDITGRNAGLISSLNQSQTEIASFVSKAQASLHMLHTALGFGIGQAGLHALSGAFEIVTAAAHGARGETEEMWKAIESLPFGLGHAIHSFKEMTAVISGAADEAERLKKAAELDAEVTKGAAPLYQKAVLASMPQPARSLQAIEFDRNKLLAENAALMQKVEQQQAPTRARFGISASGITIGDPGFEERLRKFKTEQDIERDYLAQQRQDINAAADAERDELLEKEKRRIDELQKKELDRLDAAQDAAAKLIAKRWELEEKLADQAAQSERDRQMHAFAFLGDTTPAPAIEDFFKKERIPVSDRYSPLPPSAALFSSRGALSTSDAEPTNLLRKIEKNTRRSAVLGMAN